MHNNQVPLRAHYVRTADFNLRSSPTGKMLFDSGCAKRQVSMFSQHKLAIAVVVTATHPSVVVDTVKHTVRTAANVHNADKGAACARTH